MPKADVRHHLAELARLGAERGLRSSVWDGALEELTRILEDTAFDDSPHPARSASLLESVGAAFACQAMQELAAMVARFARANSPVTVLGETGTGKELIAKALHLGSPRRDRPFVAVNCAAISEHLVESTLFGHRRGAFTGAERDQKGKFELADRGTLFLDEIAELRPSAQASILRALQNGEIAPLGGQAAKRVDVRLIVATHRNLPREIREGRFREDLYYRVNGMQLLAPPLRERGADDIVMMAARFMSEFSKKNGTPELPLTHQAKKFLIEHPWPGNVRELRNYVERVVLLQAWTRPAEQPDVCRRSDAEGPVPTTWREYQDQLATFRLDMLERLLARHDGNAAAAASNLGITRTGFLGHLKRARAEAPKGAGE
ncbi:MAG: sigma 54-interacting transcriptional regulator [Myxococcaceae bacterium]